MKERQEESATVAVSSRLNTRGVRIFVPNDVREEMKGLDLSQYIKKGRTGYDYLPWAVVMDYMLKHFPELTVDISVIDVDVHETDDIPRGTFILVQFVDAITGKTSAYFRSPVISRQNKMHKSIDVPNARDINDEMQRAIVKAVALFTGIGLNLYTRIDEEELEEHIGTPVVDYEDDEDEEYEEYDDDEEYDDEFDVDLEDE
jgi:hypothetical protein